MLVKYSQEKVDFLKGISTHLLVGEDRYYYIPFFFKEIENCVFELHTIDSLPDNVISLNKRAEAARKEPIPKKVPYDKTGTHNIYEYLEAIRAQLYCNATESYSNKYITYTFTNKQVQDNVGYFRKCMESNLSPYKALLFFDEFLNEPKIRQ